MFKQLQELYPDIQHLDTANLQLLKERWRGKVYLELPCTNYEIWLSKFYVASSNFCLVFAKVPLLLDHKVLYDYIFYQAQILIFPVDKYVLTIAGFYKKLPYDDLVRLYTLGKLYTNNSYKKVKD